MESLLNLAELASLLFAILDALLSGDIFLKFQSPNPLPVDGIIKTFAYC